MSDKPDHGLIDQITLQRVPEGWAIGVRRSAPLLRPDGSVASQEYHRTVFDAGVKLPKGVDPLVAKVARALK